MHRLAVSAVLLLVVACGAPTPTPTVAPTDSPAPTLSWMVAHTLEGWTPVCGGVPYLDCYGVAAVFANNLARNWQWVQEQSRGVVRVTPRPACPPFEGDEDSSVCWQASATIADGQVCMVLARQTHPVMGFDFGQVGGDEMAGLFVPAGYMPRFPCV